MRTTISSRVQAIARPRAKLVQPSRDRRTELQHQQFLDIAVAQGEGEIEPDRGSRLLPRLSDQMLLQARQADLRRAHQLMHRRVGRAHFGEHLLGRHAAVHQPPAQR